MLVDLDHQLARRSHDEGQGLRTGTLSGLALDVQLLHDGHQEGACLSIPDMCRQRCWISALIMVMTAGVRALGRLTRCQQQCMELARVLGRGGFGWASVG